MRYLVTSFYGLFHIQTSVKVAGSSYTVRTVYGAVLMLLAILASSLIFHSTTYAAPGDPISIPDANFEACVLDEVTHANPTYVTEAEAAAYNGLLDCGQSGVSSVEGLHFFTAVTVLYLLDNSISDLSPLAGLTNLTYLHLGENSISDLSPLAGLTNLTSLTLGENSISDLSPLAGLTNLTTLQLHVNSISDLSPLAGLTNLTGLQLSENSISDLSPLAGLTNLTTLHLYENSISDLSPLAGLTNLTSLYLHKNSISDLSPLAGLTNLTYLWIGYNSISDISPLSNLASLTSLLIGGNSISLPSLAWGVSQSNPLKGLDGNPLVPTSSSSAFAYDTLSNSWLFSAGGTYSVAYTQSVTLGSATTTFSGVITQSQEGAAGAIPGVPNTGSFMAFANPIAVAILGLISTIALAYLVHGKKRHNHK